MPETIPSLPKAVLVYHHICQVCGHEWENENPSPRQCRKCWSRRWNRRDGPTPKKETEDAQE